MKEHQMYPHNPNSAESILTNKLKDTSQAWIEGQRALVLEAMNDYAQQELSAYKGRLKDLIHDMKRTCLDNAEYLALEKIEETLDTL